MKIKKIVYGLFIIAANICVASDFSWHSYSSKSICPAVQHAVQHNKDSSPFFSAPGKISSGPASNNSGPFFEVSVSPDNMGSYPSGLSCQTAFALKFRELQKNGDIAGIQAHIEQMKKAHVLCGRVRKIDLVTSILNEPITQIMHDIKHGTLEQAQAAIRQLFTISPGKYRCGPNQHPAIFEHKQIYYKQKYTYDVLQEAKRAH